jgi:hypothetical protein
LLPFHRVGNSNKHIGKTKSRPCYTISHSVMHGCCCVACIAGFLADLCFADLCLLCCCKMPISLYWLSRSAFFEVLSIEHHITVTRTQCPMSCSYLLRTGGGSQFSNLNACQDSWGCGEV